MSLRDEIQDLNINYLALLHRAAREEDPKTVEVLFGVDEQSIEIIKNTPAHQLTRAATKGGLTMMPRVGPTFWQSLRKNDLAGAVVQQAFELVGRE